MFAEGMPFSSTRPKPNAGKKHKNWAMWNELTALCPNDGVTVAVDADDPAPNCDSAEVVVDAITDGGNFDISSVVAGTVTFTPDTQCTATLECADVASNNTCP